MAYALRTAKSKFLFTLPNSLSVALEAASLVGMPQSHVFLLEGSRPGFKTIQNLIEDGTKFKPEPSYRIPPDQTNKDVCGYLNFSSGTTGLPKAVMLSHHNIIAQCHQLRQVQVVEEGEELRALAVTPLFHISKFIFKQEQHQQQHQEQDVVISVTSSYAAHSAKRLSREPLHAQTPESATHTSSPTPILRTPADLYYL